MNHFSKARYLMVKQQVNPWSVWDPRILEIMGELPREQFVPEPYQALAYSETEIAIGHDQIMLTPKVAARIIQACQIGAEDTVLEIGTGTGYMTAILCQLAKHVHSLEIYPDLMDRAESTLQAMSINNLSLHLSNGALGLEHHAPYPVIIATGAYHHLPETLKHQLAVGGRLLTFVGKAPAQQACLITRQSQDHFVTEVLFETSVPYLVQIEKPSTFQF
jgi:protein-L-isoaspartate(D-aspartate) O-methyltransferase